MLKKIITIIVLSLVSAVLVSCGGKTEGKDVDVGTNDKALKSKAIAGRWYTTSQLLRGKKVFNDNCVVCHGDKGQGLAENWQKSLPDGSFPAPPLNGSAHTWHHSKALLLGTVNNGGIALGGTMPAFKDKLSDKEKEAVLAHVMSLWPDATYKQWAKRNPLP